jgi:hypothetical protein
MFDCKMKRCISFRFALFLSGETWMVHLLLLWTSSCAMSERVAASAGAYSGTVVPSPPGSSCESAGVWIPNLLRFVSATLWFTVKC